MADLVKFKNVSKSFDGKVALSGVNLTVPKKRIVGLLGKNGSGKTTTIKLINDLLTPDSGEVRILGGKPGIESKKIISYLPERTYLDKTMVAAGAINMFAEFYEDFDVDKAYQLMADMGLDAGAKINSMSKGMQEKLQLILVMSRKAKLYVLDEPLGGVDPATRDYILDTILSNFSEDASILISTHLISDIERILDEVIFISDGRVMLQDSADKLRAKYNKSIDQIFRKEFKNAR